MSVGFKKYAKFKKIEICTQKRWETCLIWSFLVKMERWQDVTSLSWAHLMLEIKYHKAMIACLSCLSRSVDPLVDWQWLWHCHEELSVLEREERHWLVAALWKSRLRPRPGWTLQEPNQINRSPDPAHPQPGPYRTTNKLKLCHISNFLLALLYLLNLLKLLKFSVQTAMYNFLILLGSTQWYQSIQPCVQYDLRCAISRLILM